MFALVVYLEAADVELNGLFALRLREKCVNVGQIERHELFACCADRDIDYLNEDTEAHYFLGFSEHLFFFFKSFGVDGFSGWWNIIEAEYSREAIGHQT